jgi:polysaccharide deacetylase family protein (PEP-CTERM system associated)
VIAIDSVNPRAVVNCFSVDVESFAESNVESFTIHPRHLDRSRQSREIETNMDFLLGLLAEYNVKATFFFLGRLARDLPEVVRRVAQEKHEIACHSFEHFRIYGLEPDVFEDRLRRAKGLLEDASGQQVYGFRAPDFSITHSSEWALDALRNAGFAYDSSIFPFGGHDVYGIEEAPSDIHTLANGLVEWPLATIQILRRRVPFGGGGYFRLYPFTFTEFCFARLNRRRMPCMFYIHPYEVGPVVERIAGLSTLRQFRHYYHCNALSKRLGRLLRQFHFAPAITALRHLGKLSETISLEEIGHA